MEATVYNAQGKKSGSVALPESVFGVKWNDALIHQVVVSMQSNARPYVAHTKTRGEVRGGGRKPWQQKGTGRARHGSIRSPIWRGGGVTHGPRNEKNYMRTIPRNMRAKALFMALSRKFKDGEVVFVDSFGITAPKTVLAKKSLDALAAISGLEKITSKRRNAALIALSDGTEATKKSFRNIGNVACVPVRDLNPVSVLGSSFIIIENPDAGIAILENRASKKKAEAVTKQK
ncbi:50S ribosomal protein L4 [Candidatus Kaiserbacteria bacterium RIFCSPLOWO2_01_FULL_54_24]|uniref:Large ribosomal subunit protein uL4 n=1 Tax=Candidatus Kaiserbacteria bacterium RIFCSPLOWO2_01_FULL_54_24 TaxID=1798515 RepID=A0A1F6EVV5_9BACT|nr:MAG: 50S ribosomal protein L4 [Candidatus Kaiserbacteria bacterium RIFCSPLOWO2_01_FULL_54_24]